MTAKPSPSVRILADRGVTTEDVRTDALAGSVVASLVQSAATDVDSAEDTLRQHIAKAQRELEYAVQSLDGGFGVNALGILQRTADDTDRSAALLQAAALTLSRAAYTYRMLREAGDLA